MIHLQSRQLMDTQGTRLDSEKIKKLLYWEVKHFQINRIFGSPHQKCLKITSQRASLKTRSAY